MATSEEHQERFIQRLSSRTAPHGRCRSQKAQPKHWAIDFLDAESRDPDRITMAYQAACTKICCFAPPDSSTAFQTVGQSYSNWICAPVNAAGGQVKRSQPLEFPLFLYIST